MDVKFIGLFLLIGITVTVVERKIKLWILRSIYLPLKLRYKFFYYCYLYVNRYDANYIFHLACGLNNLSIVQYFLERKLVNPSFGYPWIEDFYDTEKLSKTFGDLTNSLEIACVNGHTEIVRLLLKDRQVRPNQFIFRIAIEGGYLEIVRLLLSDTRLVCSVNNDAICLASSEGHIEIVRLLLNDKRVDPSILSNWSIRSAAKKGHLEVVRLLLQDPRVDPSDMDDDAIYYANNLDIVRLLLQDPRVKFDHIGNENVKQELQREERNKLKQMLSFIYLTIEKFSPQISISGKIKAKIPKKLIRKMALHACRDQIYLSYTRYKVLPFY